MCLVFMYLFTYNDNSDRAIFRIFSLAYSDSPNELANNDTALVQCEQQLAHANRSGVNCSTFWSVVWKSIDRHCINVFFYEINIHVLGGNSMQNESLYKLYVECHMVSVKIKKLPSRNNEIK